MSFKLPRPFPFVLIALLMLMIVGTTSAQEAPTFESADCPFEVPEDRTVECGYLTVPAARDMNGDPLPDMGTMRLAVAIFRSDSDDVSPDPVVYLEGGPGGDALETIPLVFEQRFGAFVENRDFIMWDQRGTGYSQPSLACPEFTTYALDSLDVIAPLETIAEESRAVAFECRDRLLSEGVDFSQYNSRESAQDLDDLRVALGYDEWNLYGLSYGTRLALTAMRDTPEGIRSVVLDSAYPLEANLYASTLPNAQRAFTTLFEACAADADCNAAYPDLETVFYDTVDTLNENPVAVILTNPFSGETYDSFGTGDGLVSLLFQMLYITDIIPLLPQVIYDVSEGDYEFVNLVAGAFLAQLDYASIAQQFAVQCNEEVALAVADDATPEPDDTIPTALRRSFELSATLGEAIRLICDEFDTGSADPIENEPVVSDIRTLVLAGTFDPITSPAFGQQVAESLTNEVYLEFEGYGHGVAATAACPQSIVIAFFNDPDAEPDTACRDAETLPVFIVPATEITLVPFENQVFAVEGVIPEGWSELAPGIYAPSANSQNVLFIQAFPGTANDVVNLLETQLSVDIPAGESTREANGFTWTLYEFEVSGLTLFLAAAERDGTAYLVLVQSPADEGEFYNDSVFLPVVDAVTPLE